MVGANGRDRAPATVRDPAARDPAVRARVLGGLEVATAAGVVARGRWQRAAAERLVKLLLVTPAHRVSREIAAEILWPDAPPEAGRASLRKAVLYARRALGGADALAADRVGIALDASRLDLDLDRLTLALDTLSPGGPRAALGNGGLHEPDAMDPGEALDVALRFGALELLPDDRYEEWLLEPRERLAMRWQAVALEAARRAFEAGRVDDARAVVARLLERDPADEAAHRLAIEMYAAEGRHHAARRQYELCRRELRDALDVEPAAETEDVLRRTTAVSAPAPATRPPSIVGRRLELSEIGRVLDRVASGQLAGLVLSGSTGMGKTRLLQEVVANARATGWRVVEWQAVDTPTASALAYGPFRVGLAAVISRNDVLALGDPASSVLATLLPSLRVRPALSFAARPALAAAIVSAIDRLARERPIVFAIDDIPALDPASVDVFEMIVSGLADVPVLLVATHRDETPPTRPVAALLEHLRRSGGLELRVGPLSPGDIEPLVVAHLGGERVDPGVIRVAFDLSRGNPLFCLELVRAAIARGALRLDDSAWSATTPSLATRAPDSVRGLVTARATTLPPDAREVLAAVAELGPQVSFEVLAAALPALGDRLVAGLDASLESGLLIERGPSYAFAHPMFRLAIAGDLRHARRAEIHLAAARSLAGADHQAAPEELASVAATLPGVALVAAHALTAAELGAAAAISLAVTFGFAAGERERALFDHAKARSLLDRALAFWERLPPEEAKRYGASAACEALCAARVAMGDDAGALAAGRLSAAAARTPDERATAYVSMSWVPYRHGDFEASLSILSEGLAVLSGDRVARARLLAETGWVLVRMRRFDEALSALDQAVPILVPTSLQLAVRVLDQYGTLLRMLGRLEESVARLERSLAIALELGDSRAELYARIHLTTTLTRAGMAGRAAPHAERALELARMTGDRYLESVAAWQAALVQEALGSRPEAIAMRRRELELIDAIGGNPHHAALAHAHIAMLARASGQPDLERKEARLARRVARRCMEEGFEQRVEDALASGVWREVEL